MNRAVSLWTLALCAQLACSTDTTPPAAAAGSGGQPEVAGAPAAGGGGAGEPALPAAGGGAGGQTGGTAAPAAGSSAPAPAVCKRQIEDLGVARADRAGYPPYAASGCSLLYVASDGALHLRSLASDEDTVIAAAAELPARPTLAGPAEDPARILAWESERDGCVQVRFGGETRAIRGDYARSAQPRATADAVVLTGFRTQEPTSDADVLLYDPTTQNLRVVGGGPGQQLFPDVSATQVAYSDFAEDADQRFDDDGRDLADVVLVERATLERRTLAAPGKQAFPLFGGDGSIVYLHWEVGHPEPKLAAYAIMAWQARSAQRVMLAKVETQAPYVRPSVYGNTVEWVERPFSGDERVMRLDMQSAVPRNAFSMPGVQLYATASSPNATLVATLAANQTVPVLRAIAR